ncbi:hypothetical protein BC628DRAFT_645743 [Trametes gibbosa]|nr:hypothetical protein BC628DRAFT_645743 [Trametes gibbosa]
MQGSQRIWTPAGLTSPRTGTSHQCVVRRIWSPWWRYLAVFEDSAWSRARHVAQTEDGRWRGAGLNKQMDVVPACVQAPEASSSSPGTKGGGGRTSGWRPPIRGTREMPRIAGGRLIVHIEPEAPASASPTRTSAHPALFSIQPKCPARAGISRISVPCRHPSSPSSPFLHPQLRARPPQLVHINPPFSPRDPRQLPLRPPRLRTYPAWYLIASSHP